MTTTRRTLIKSAAWSVPVIAAAVAVPLAAASTTPPTPEPRQPISCILLNGTGSPFYAVTYSDGETVQLHRSEVVKDKTLKALCKVPANHNEGK